MAGPAGKMVRRVWQTLSDTKTRVILLLVTVILSAAGTVILQRPATDPNEIQRAYTPQMLRLFDGLGLTDVFHAWWFVLLLALVSLSIIAATYEHASNFKWSEAARAAVAAGTGRLALPLAANAHKKKFLPPKNK
jgi:cytochrome c biogenesis protein